MTGISYQELDALSGEVLPGKTLLSLVTFNVDNSRHTYNFPEGDGKGGDGGGTTVAYACQSERVHGTPGALGSLGLGSNNPSSGITCVPGTVTSH
ncbi:hypothetical protein [Streptomyces oceani]|uniref:Uncharacterized protein n=1 Tax=Streptomyces oceani TaxID=1075402 RepID=A0A1E7KLD0_9ACTN|nr:hypothetical protein [Streptomyces oceani]OEV04755.1 hypothetical protein AN216_05585 [Streptomyces oceani]